MGGAFFIPCHAGSFGAFSALSPDGMKAVSYQFSSKSRMMVLGQPLAGKVVPLVQQ
jgi:hypothetical protein